MHATAQPGGRSQVKASSDGAQKVSSSLSHGKGKKRERLEQDSEPVRRVQRKDDSKSQKSEIFLNVEISRITDRGSLLDHESVEKLIQLMTPDKADKKIDLTGRSILAGVVAATDKFDCLSWFVHLKGLPVFDEWLQEIHKGKVDDGNSYKDGDKSVEEFLLVLLRALDKLPVNLRALQMCNIGKSVNHLRSHKNLEIQRKARSLVDIWKKRVEAEMNIDDGKPGSNTGVAWHGRRISESSQGGHKISGSSKNVMKSSSSQVCTHIVLTTKFTQGEMAQTTASTSPGCSRSTSSPTAVGANSKDAQSKNVAVGESRDHPPTGGKDDRSSSSSQSHSQSNSSDHIKAAESSGKEDMRSSTAVSVGASEALRHTSRLRKTVSGLPEQVSRGAQSDRSNRSPMHKASMPEKLSRSGSVSEKMHDLHVADGNNHKLIVKIPNRGRSPTVSKNGGSADELCPSSNKATSPTCTDKPEKPGCSSKEKGDGSLRIDASDMTTKSWHSSDLKEALTGSDEADGTSAANHEEVLSANGDHSRKMNESPKVLSSFATQEVKPWKSHKPSFSMNALVESCVKHSEPNALISADDDVGMNLLASVAASEMCKCETVGSNSPEKTSVAEDSVIGNSERTLDIDKSTQEQTAGTNKVKQESKKQDESSSFLTNGDGGEGGLYSSDSKLATGLSDSVLPRKQNDEQLTDSSVVPSNEVALVNKVRDWKEEISESESGLLTTNGEHIENARKEKTPSIPRSEAVGSNNKMETDSVTSLGMEKSVAGGVARLSDRMTVTSSNSQSAVDEKLNTSGGLASASTDNSGNDKEGKPQNKEIPCHSNEISDLSKADALHASSTELMEKRGFDLNEGFTPEEPNGLPASVTVAAASKGAFVPPENLLRTGGEIGWKGSAATSAFRPAEPRKVSEFHVNTSKSSRPFLNIDLNVPDNSMQDDFVSPSSTADVSRNEKITQLRALGGFDLDLNQVHEATEAGQYSVIKNLKLEIPGLPSKPSILSNGGSSGRRNFDLNNGPLLEEVGVEASKLGQNIWSHNMPSQPPVVGLRMNNADMGNYASWFPQGNVTPAVSIPSVLPDRGDQALSIATSGASQRIYYIPPGSNPFAPDVCRGPVLSSSPALNFPSAPYQYPPMFPFGTSFPVPGATLPGNVAMYMDSSSGVRHNIPTGQSQYICHPGLISSNYQRPYLVSVPDGRSISSLGGSHGLDLNSGPGSIDVESRNEASPFALRQFSVASSQAFTDDQSRMVKAPAAGVLMKRKEPDGGWGDTEKSKQQPSWH